MAKFQIFQYMFRPVMENQAGLPYEEFQAVDVQKSLNEKQDLLGIVLDNYACEQNELKNITNSMVKHLNTARLSIRAIFM